MSERAKLRRLVTDIAGCINAAWSFAETDPKKTRWYLDRAASLTGDLRVMAEKEGDIA